MAAVVQAVTSVVSGVVEAVGNVVEDVGNVVSKVGQKIDQYVIQPILDDPLTAIATVAAATYLGPAAATMFGTNAAVGVGLAAAAGNTAAGLVQGESFDEAIKGGAIAGLTAGTASYLFGPGSAGEGPMGPPAPAGLGENFVGPPMESGSYFTEPSALATSTPVAPQTDISGTNLEPMPSSTATAPAPAPAPEVTPDASTVSATPSPLQTVQTTPATIPSAQPSPLSVDYSVPKIDLTTGLPSGPGLQANTFTPADSFNIYGEPNYSLSGAPGTTSGPGLQVADAPYLSRMGGAQGMTMPVQGMDQFTYGPGTGEWEGATSTWQNEVGGKTYGLPSADGTISAGGFTPEQPTIAYGNENIGEMGGWDKFTSGDLTGAAKDLGTAAWDYAKEHPWYTAAGLVAADQLLSPKKKPDTPKPTSGGTRDKSFDKGLDLYAYMRDRQNYQGDLTKYGQSGQGGEQNFFANERFVPIPIQAKMGGLIQMKHFAQGGQMRDPRVQGRPQMDPRRAQLMAAMAQQHPAGMGGPQTGRPMPPQGGRPPMMPPQGGPQGGLQQGMPPQAQRPQMPQRPRDPKMAYYQYGNPPPQAKAMGGLSQVHSMRIGGGADGRSDDVNAVLSDGEYVMDAETVAMLGNGSSKAGAAKLDQMRANLRKQKGQALSKGKISPNAKSPLSYLKGA
jgi:hypothetical protein